MHLKPVIKQLYIIHLLCALSLLSLSFSLPFFLSPPISPPPPPQLILRRVFREQIRLWLFF